MKLPRSLVIKIALILAIVFAFAVILTLPARTFRHDPYSDSSSGFNGFSGAEVNANKIPFTWALGDSTIEYAQVPRYTPLDLRLRLGLQRPAGSPPARIEVYESALDKGSQPRLLTVIQADNGNNDVRDYYLTVPPRDAGQGLKIELRSNTFKAPGDRRELGFIFLESELRLPKSHILKLFWPYPYWIAGLALLAVLSLWWLEAGLTLLETGLMAAMIGLVLVSCAPATYQYSWWLLLLAGGIAACYGLDRYLRRKGKDTVWPIMAASALLLGFFLYNPDTNIYDIDFYHNWSQSVQHHGLWNIYNQTPSLNYLPLIVYVLWFYNLIVYPLGLQTNYMAWRVFAGLLYLVTLGIVYLLRRAATNPVYNTAVEQNSGPFPRRRMVLLAFNIALFYNPVIYGQSDILPTLLLLLSFYLVYRRQPLWGGLLLGLTAISKPQAWFILPLLVWWLWQRCGWRKGLAGSALGGVVGAGLALYAFGLDWHSITAYLTQSQLAGQYENDIPTAFNLTFLVLGKGQENLPLWLSLLGFLLAGLVLLFTVIQSRGYRQPLERYGLSAMLAGLACFSFLIKMKERYLLYGLPFMGLAALQSRKFYRPFVLLSVLQLVHLVISLYSNGPWGERGIASQFYLWCVLVGQDWFLRLLSVATLALTGYLLYLYWQETRTQKLN
ncbi:MAG TPA: glycosyltransferase 87 family protein [Chloroflexia bacterium]|nr:glycosyltransferase 87 family protein [Chloroflexia bacterium]